jgi:hypothetical protein
MVMAEALFAGFLVFVGIMLIQSVKKSLKK